MADTLELARILLREEDDQAAAEALLREVLSITGADRGFVVVREGEQFTPKFAVQIDSTADDDVARFSRGLVREALAANRPIYSVNPAEDPELSQTASLMASAGRSVFVVPLSSGETRFGALYMEHPRIGGFTVEARKLVLDVAELAGLALHRAVERTLLSRRSRELEHDVLAKYDFTGIITRDPATMRVLQTVGQVANAKASVLIRGESGTGKELIARALHVNSQRARGPYVTLHCAALPATMLESELFGHVRGAFTGADKDRNGRLASANNGTLFLDEIGELPAEVQAKLLRAVQFGELQRVGSDKVERVDVRIVAATHRDLMTMVKAGTFREDLYYRLRVVEVELPPLRERRNDIPLLGRHFLKHYGGADRKFSPAALACLERYAWPGNIRELANAVERSVLLAGPTVDVAALPPEIARYEGGPPAPRHTSVEPATQHSFNTYHRNELEEARRNARTAVDKAFFVGLMTKYAGDSKRAAAASGFNEAELQEAIVTHGFGSGPQTTRSSPLLSEEEEQARSLRGQLVDLERKRILEALDKCGGNQTATAKVLGISRRTLVNRLSEYKITRPRNPRS